MRVINKGFQNGRARLEWATKKRAACMQLDLAAVVADPNQECLGYGWQSTFGKKPTAICACRRVVVLSIYAGISASGWLP